MRRLALRSTARRLETPGDAARSAEQPRDERVVVEIRGDEEGYGLLSAAAYHAARLKTPWLAVAVHTPDWGLLPAYDRSRLEDQISLARRLGAETVVAMGDRADETLLAVARAYGATEVVAPLPRPGPHFRHLFKELRSLFERGRDLAFHLVDAERPPEDRDR